jgi:hypothetical protein
VWTTNREASGSGINLTLDAAWARGESREDKAQNPFASNGRYNLFRPPTALLDLPKMPVFTGKIMTVWPRGHTSTIRPKVGPLADLSPRASLRGEVLAPAAVATSGQDESVRQDSAATPIYRKGTNQGFVGGPGALTRRLAEIFSPSDVTAHPLARPLLLGGGELTLKGHSTPPERGRRRLA